MSEHDETAAAESQTGSTVAPGPQADRASRSAGLWWKILLFAGGVLVGVLGVGLLSVATPDFAAASAAGPGSTGGQGQPGGSVPRGVEARVNAACLGVINEAQDVYAVLGDLGPAIDDVDLTALDDIVRRLQPIEPRLGRDLTGCRVDTSVTSGQTSPGAPPSALPPTAAPATTPPATTAPTTTAPTTTAPTPASGTTAPGSTAPTAVPPTEPAPQPSVTR